MEKHNYYDIRLLRASDISIILDMMYVNFISKMDEFRTTNLHIGSYLDIKYMNIDGDVIDDTVTFFFDINNKKYYKLVKYHFSRKILATTIIGNDYKYVKMTNTLVRADIGYDMKSIQTLYFCLPNSKCNFEISAYQDGKYAILIANKIVEVVDTIDDLILYVSTLILI